MELIQALRSLFLFKNIDFENAERLLNLCKNVIVRDFSNGDTILCAADNSGLPIILSGCAQIRSHSGLKTVVLRYVHEGDTFGAASLFKDGSTHRTVVISDGNTSVAFIPKDIIEKAIKTINGVAENYIGFLSDRIEFLNKKITAFSQGSAEAKLAVYLLSLQSKDGIIDIPVTLSALSEDLNIGRASLYRAFDSLSNMNAIKKDANRIVVLDKTKLENLL